MNTDGGERRLIRVERTASWRQLGVLVTDGSGSMTDPVDAGGFSGTKGEAVSTAVQDLLSRFQASSKAANFHFAGVTFDDAVRGQWEPVPVSTLDPLRDYDPTAGAEGGTRVAEGLQAAQQIVTDFLAGDTDGLPSTAVVLLLTDGETEDPDRVRETAARLKADPRVQLACAFLATKGQPPHGLSLLREICSQPSTRWSTTAYDPETLRKFWTASMTVLSPEPVDITDSSRRALPGGRPLLELPPSPR